MKKLKIFNDPIYGFIPIQNALIFDIIEHPYFQRLRRITQMGLSYLVYPGVSHSRFEHAIGCMHLMGKAIDILKFKKIKISKVEREALEIAILLHDIGHGPFSHTLEHSLARGIHHESISLKFMQVFNKEFNGKLSLAIKMFKGEYERPFFNQLISSQLDIDRLDYLKRDSFYSGVTEGNINSQRLITMLDVVEDKLVIDKKGIYSVEKFIVARRLMYWMVYLHKTSLVAENILVNILRRAKELSMTNSSLSISDDLNYFLSHDITESNFDNEKLGLFARLDDYDIISSIKKWMNHDDFILSSLCKSIINRDLPKIIIQNDKFTSSYIDNEKQKIKIKLNIESENQLSYFVSTGTIINQAYNKNEYPIGIKFNDKKVIDLISASDHLNIETLTKPVTKHFVYYPK